MAWAAFQKSNWTRAAGPQKMIQYIPASSNGTATGGVVFAAAGSVVPITVTAAFQFKGNGMMEAYLPTEGGSTSGFGGGQTAAAAGVCIENAYLIGAASGSYAKGNHPLCVIELSCGSAFTTAATGFDLIIMQS
jgi:hypothetical protein